MNAKDFQHTKTSDLIQRVKEELSNVGYKTASINVYQKYWDDLLKYESNNEIKAYSPQIGLRFLDDVYRIRVNTALSKQERVCARSIMLLNNFERDGMLFPSNSSTVSNLRCFCETLEAFKKHQIDKFQVSRCTLKSYDNYLGQFLLYLEKHNIRNLNQIKPAIIVDYCESHSIYSTSTLYNSFCSLRVFLRYLRTERLTDVDYSSLVPSVSYKRDSKLPSTFTPAEAQRLFEAVDKSSPMGKRDYAILMIAYKLGLRSIDIRCLQFSEIHWEKNTIELTMKKTGKGIVLPLLEEVGEALIDYIKFGRPLSDSTIVFLRQVSPIKPISAPGMTTIVKRYANKAGIISSPGRSTGPHAMRSSLASALLAENVPLPVISEVLGHSSTRTTESYLKIDIKRLRNCSLDVPPFDWNVSRGEVF